MTFGTKIRGFGRQIYNLYESYPLTMNTLAGGTVFSLGEVVVRVQQAREQSAGHNKGVLLILRSDIDWYRTAEIGALGCVLNGVGMLYWYKFLNFAVGSSVTTRTVLFKCLCDQLFFAASADALFLALCAYKDKNNFFPALEEVKKTFLTTWINDCSIWPSVNFVGFAYVPVSLQPTYMSCVQLFWQIYISSVAASAAKGGDATDATLTSMFHQLDTDDNGFIEAEELRANLQMRGIDVTMAEVIRMIEDLHVIFENNEMHANATNKDRVTLAEFKYMAKLYYENKDSKDKVNDLWAKILKTDLTLQKGVGAVLTLKKNFEEKQKLREMGDEAMRPQHSPRDSHQQRGPHHMSTLKEKLSESRSGHRTRQSSGSGGGFAVKPLASEENIRDAEREVHHRQKIASQWDSDRKDAVERCVFGTVFLFAVALIRVRYFKV